MKYIKIGLGGYIIAVVWSLLATQMVNGLPHGWEISFQDWIHSWIPQMAVQTFKEEFLFRWGVFAPLGIFFPLLFAKWQIRGVLLVGTSIAFGLYGDHYFPVAFVSGLILGGTYLLALQEKKILHLDGLLIAFSVHLLHNITLVLIYCGGTFK